MARAIQGLRSDLQHLGLARTLARLGYKLANRVGSLKVLLVLKMTMEDLNPASLDRSTPYGCRFVPGEEMYDLSRSFGAVLPAAFVETAIEKGDECFGIFDGGRCAAFGWYSRRPTRVMDSLLLYFDPALVYMYNGYTRPEYRGRRLHALGIARALEAYTSRGAKAMISIAEMPNYSSRKSAYRMGFKDCGAIYVVGLGGRSLLATTRGCDPYRVRIEKLPRARSRARD